MIYLQLYAYVYKYIMYTYMYMYAVSAKKSDGRIFCFPRHSFAEVQKEVFIVFLSIG